MTACGALLCDHCRQPGRCCSGFGLNLTMRRVRIEPGDEITGLHVLVMLATAVHQDCRHQPTIGVPFMPLYELKPGHWRYWCPLLGADGRCTDYENRPRLCADFTAGTDALCAEYRPEPGGSVELRADSP